MKCTLIFTMIESVKNFVATYDIAVSWSRKNELIEQFNFEVYHCIKHTNNALLDMTEFRFYPHTLSKVEIWADRQITHHIST